MKNNMSYEEAVNEIKLYGEVQRFMKRLKQNSVEDGRVKQENIRVRRIQINLLLSIIAAHKQSRKLYGILREVQETLGMSTEIRARVDEVLK